MKTHYTDDESIRLLEREIRRVQRLVTKPETRARLICDLEAMIIEVRKLGKTKPHPEESERREETQEDRNQRIIEEAKARG